MLIQRHIMLVMGLQRDHQMMLMGIRDGLVHQKSGNPMMLHGRIYSQIDNMKSLFLMKLIGPFGVQIIFTQNKVPEGLQTGIFLDQILICF